VLRLTSMMSFAPDSSRFADRVAGEGYRVRETSFRRKSRKCPGINTSCLGARNYYAPLQIASEPQSAFKNRVLASGASRSARGAKYAKARSYYLSGLFSHGLKAVLPDGVLSALEARQAGAPTVPSSRRRHLSLGLWLEVCPPQSPKSSEFEHV